MKRLLKSFWLLAALALLTFAACIPLYPPPPPPPPPPPGPGAPPAPAAFTCELVPDHAARGQEIEIHLRPPREIVSIFYNGRPIPKIVKSGGAIFIVTVPGDAVSGAFEIQVEGKTIPCQPHLTVTK